MKRLLFLIAALCACALPVCAQNSNLGPAIGSGLPPVPSYYTGAIQFPGAPSGACAAPMLAENAATGHLFDCLNGAWNDIGSTGGAGNALTSNPLSQFAATTSAQLAGVLSDETGTGLAVFATNPVFTTPNLGTPSAINLTNATATPPCATCTTNAAALTSNAVVIGGGGQAESAIAADTTTTHALFATAGAPAFRAIAAGDVPFSAPGPIGGSSPSSVNWSSLLNQTHMLCTGANPTVTSTGSVATIASGNGSCAFTVAVNAGGISTFTVNFSGTSVQTGWICTANDRTTHSSTVFQTVQTNSALSTTTATMSNITNAGATGTNWTASDVISLQCAAD